MEIHLQVEEHMKRPLLELNQFYQVKCSLSTISKKITKIIIQNQMRLNQIRKLLEKISPKVIIEVVGYDATSMAVNEIAHDMNIRTYELQHGTIYKDGFIYNYNTKEVISQFADYFLAFGEFWKKDIKYPIDEKHVIPVGFPYIENRVNEMKDICKKEGKQCKTVLFLSQGTNGMQMSLLACQLVKRIEREKINIHIIYKLHPGEYPVWEKRYPELRKLDRESRIQVIDTHICDLYSLFSQADIQIGVDSTAIFEGLAFGLTTIIYKIGEDTCMNYLYENNLAYCVNTVEEIMKIILYGNKVIEKADVELFWKSNAINNMIEAINGEKAEY